jgi:hypothetical protein
MAPHVEMACFVMAKKPVKMAYASPRRSAAPWGVMKVATNAMDVQRMLNVMMVSFVAARKPASMGYAFTVMFRAMILMKDAMKV